MRKKEIIILFIIANLLPFILFHPEGNFITKSVIAFILGQIMYVGINLSTKKDNKNELEEYFLFTTTIAAVLTVFVILFKHFEYGHMNYALMYKEIPGTFLIVSFLIHSFSIVEYLFLHIIFKKEENKNHNFAKIVKRDK